MTCAPSAPNVALDGPEPAELSLRAEVAHSLAAELDSAGIGVCLGDEANAAGSSPLADVELATAPPYGSWRLRVQDHVTGKTVERTVALASMPPDTWAIALAVYIEELLQASWTELQLAQRTYLAQRAQPVPSAISRELARASPHASRQTLLRLGLAAWALAWSSGLSQAGARLDLHLRALSWLEPGLHLTGALGLATHSAHGTIHTQLLAAGLDAELLLPLGERVSLRWPQSVDFGRLTFHARPSALGAAHDAARPAIFFSHGLGLRVALGAALALSAAARFCWAALPAQARDERRVATGIAGVGAQLELMVDATF